MKKPEQIGEENPRLLTYRDVAARLGLHPVTVMKMVSRRQIAFYKIGRTVRFHVAHVEDYLRRKLYGAKM